MAVYFDVSESYGKVDALLAIPNGPYPRATFEAVAADGTWRAAAKLQAFLKTEKDGVHTVCAVARPGRCCAGRLPRRNPRSRALAP